MSLLKYAALGAVGAVAYRIWRKAVDQHDPARAAFAPGQHSAEDPAPVRDAGPDAMRDTPGPHWSVEDEQADESFPASDPPGNY